MFAVELALIKKGRTGLGRASAGACPEQRVAGVDEAGRGPLAGPVVAAAVESRQALVDLMARVEAAVRS